MERTKTVGTIEIFLGKKLGEGNFGIVYEGAIKKTGERVAVKCLNKNIGKVSIIISGQR